ncbi:hypothetical protein [Hymenobacter saemangeumensis]|uniref:hypothetical protein n=1 Tax=Hymenobacter saemangeumensis TaxID=1084522 RepID=UPI0031ECD30A
MDINLQQLPDEYLAGAWRVASRVLNQNSPASPLALAVRLVLSPGKLVAQAADEQALAQGSWAVQRDELLKRPYLRFELPQEQVNALVTRLRRSPNGEQSQLSLYFASGMEMQLERV